MASKRSSRSSRSSRGGRRKRRPSQIEMALDIYLGRGEWNGRSIQGARRVLAQAGYVWSPEIRAEVERVVERQKDSPSAPGWRRPDLDVISPRKLTERGLAAIKAARRGAALYIHKFGRWLRAGAGELAFAEKLAKESPHLLAMYGSEKARRRSR